jgi:hexosaminidase
MIEVDMPGHTASLARSHPEHIACFGKAWDTYALQPPAGQLRYAHEETTAWASKLIGELVKSVKGPYMGTGGDELNKKCMVSFIALA